MARFVRSSRLPVGQEAAFAWHARPGALQRLSPPFVPVRVEASDGAITPGAEARLRLRVGPLALRWVARHTVCDPPREFRDVQVRGPFARWEHRHRFADDADDAEGTVLTDDIAYRLPLGALGERAAGRLVRRELDRMLRFRHRRTAADLALHAADRARGIRPMRIAVTGSTGLIGRALSALLTTGGHEVVPVVRGTPREDQVGWDPEQGRMDPRGLRGCDAVVHLAGQPIAARRWTEEQKRRIHDSRVHGTRAVAEALAALGEDGPRVLVSASGINYYGDRGDELLTEESPAGEGFLAEVCLAWEEATRPAAEAGVRVAVLRTGMVLTPEDGALARLLPLFRLGLGGRFGSGRQYDPWISLDDVVGLYHHALTTPEVTGPVNAVAPSPVRNAELAKALGRVLRRPAALPVPKLGPRIVAGEMAGPLLYESQRAVPAVAERTGYAFRHPELEGCLRELLGREEHR